MLEAAAGVECARSESDGRGFVVNQDEMIGGTRKGKVLMNPDDGAKAALLVPADGDHVAVVGENRKLVVFPLDQVPEMARGKGVVDEQTGKLVEAAAGVIGTITGKNASLAKDDDYQTTLTFYCKTNA